MFIFALYMYNVCKIHLRFCFDHIVIIGRPHCVYIPNRGTRCLVEKSMFFSALYLWVFPKTGVVKPPKMDGENKGSKPYEQMDDLGGKLPLFLVQHPCFSHAHCILVYLVYLLGCETPSSNSGQLPKVSEGLWSFLGSLMVTIANWGSPIPIYTIDLFTNYSICIYIYILGCSWK